MDVGWVFKIKLVEMNHELHRGRCFQIYLYYTYLAQSNKDRKDKELKQSSTTSDSGYHMGKYYLYIYLLFINSFICLSIYLFI